MAKRFVVPVLEVKLVDGDTLDLLLDLGFGVRYKVRGRIDGVDAPEKNTAAGKLLIRYVENVLRSMPVTDFQWESREWDKYGRSLGHLYFNNPKTHEHLGDLLVAVGCNEYDGKSQRGYSREQLAVIEQNITSFLGTPGDSK